MSGWWRERRLTQVTGWHLRMLLLLTCLLAVVVVTQGEFSQRLGTVSVVGTVLLVLGTVLLPGTAMTTAFLVVLCLAVLDRGDAGLLRLVASAGVLHAVHLLAGLCTLGPPATRFDVAALWPTARRWAVAQAVALPVITVVWLAAGSGVAGAGVEGGIEVAAGAAAVALLLGTVALARRAMR